MNMKTCHGTEGVKLAHESTGRKRYYVMRLYKERKNARK
ncbi:hypothetical protein E2C01_041060 [Portunus trituberculatus]|uniref:Uncharacterized protein n=1 Tax=Portunus trituberculatus TaxID=210409 RepID=A0A5B7FQV6_PORTR|nr:hypothetical protein [Portunus trituberculatus]